MKFGIMQGRIFPEDISKLQKFPKTNWLEEIHHANKIGFSDFELLYDKNLDCLSLLDSDENLKLLKRAKKEYKISTSSICIDYFSSINTNLIPNKKYFFKTLMDVVEKAKMISAKIVVVPYCDANSIESDLQLRNLLKNFLDYNLDKILIEKEISLAVELDLKAELILKAFENFEFKNIGICYDVGNSTGNGYIADQEILILKDLIKHIHIKDKPINGKNVMLGKGAVNFKKCIQALKKINYSGSCILETIYYEDPIKEANKNLNYIHNIL